MDGRNYLIFGLLTIGTLILLAITVSDPVSGETLTVDLNGEGDHISIQSAVENATEGDQILIQTGSYNESVVIGKELIIRGEDRRTTIIEGYIGYFQVNGGRLSEVIVHRSIGFGESENVTLSDLDVHGDGISGSFNTNLTILRCRAKSIYLQYSSRSTIERNEGIFEEGLDISIYGTNDTEYWAYGENRIQYNTCSRIGISEASFNIVRFNSCSNSEYDGMSFGRSRDNVVSSNVCNNNSGHGIEFREGCGSNTIERNVCVGNGRSGIYLRGWGDTLSENICTSNGRDGIEARCSQTDFIGNNCSNNTRYGISFSYWTWSDIGDWGNELSGNNVSGNQEGIHRESDISFQEEATPYALVGSICVMIPMIFGILLYRAVKKEGMTESNSWVHRMGDSRWGYNGKYMVVNGKMMYRRSYGCPGREENRNH